MPPVDHTNPVAYVGIENHEGEGAQERSMSQLLSVLLNTKIVGFPPASRFLGNNGVLDLGERRPFFAVMYLNFRYLLPRYDRSITS